MTRCATRCASVSVLPVPAPATISRGPDLNPLLSGAGSPNVTALRWGPFNFSRCDVVGMADRIYGSPPATVTASSHACDELPQDMPVSVQYLHLTETEL